MSIIFENSNGKPDFVISSRLLCNFKAISARVIVQTVILMPANINSIVLLKVLSPPRNSVTDHENLPFSPVLFQIIEKW